MGIMLGGKSWTRKQLDIAMEGTPTGNAYGWDWSIMRGALTAPQIWTGGLLILRQSRTSPHLAQRISCNPLRLVGWELVSLCLLPLGHHSWHVVRQWLPRPNGAARAYVMLGEQKEMFRSSDPLNTITKAIPEPFCSSIQNLNLFSPLASPERVCSV